MIVDPSHGTGTAYMVTPLARAGVAAGADGLMIEVHNQPELSLSDSAQALTPRNTFNSSPKFERFTSLSRQNGNSMT